MKKSFLVVIISLFLFVNSQAQNSKTVNVLFIGNSLTYYYEMPKIVQTFIDEKGLNISIEQVTFAGMSLSSHLDQIPINETRSRKKIGEEQTETEKKILSKKWDIVILQEGTVRLLIPEIRQYKVIPAINKIKELINNPSCKVFIFNTWVIKTPYPKRYCNPCINVNESIEKEECCSQEIENSDQEIKLINEGYEAVAKATSIQKTNHGELFFKISKKYPEIELYEDESHPSKLGAYLNACIFFQILTNEKPTSVKFNAQLDKKITQILKKVAGKSE